MSGSGNTMASFTDLIRPDLVNYYSASNLAYNEKILALKSSGETVYHLGFGQAPFPLMEEMIAALQEHAGKNGYMPVAGIPELRQAICRFHQRYDNLTFDPEQIIVAPGSKELIYLTMSVFNGDVLVASPTWTTYKPQSRLAGKQAYHLNTTLAGQWRITAAEVERVVQDNNLTGNKLLILCNPDNPTGTTYGEAHLQELTAACRKHNVIVISDEIYARLHYAQSHKSIATYYPEGTILSAGMSKWASAGGWRLGYHIFPRPLASLRDAVRSAASHSYTCAAAPMQHAVAQTLQDEAACHDYILHTARIMQAVGYFCHHELTAVGVSAVKPEGGYYIFPDFRNLKGVLTKRGITRGEEMCEAIFNEAKVALMSGGPAFLRPNEEFTTRLCFVNFDGKKALAASRQLGLDCPLPASFVREHCTEIHDAIKVLCTWVQEQLKTS